MIPGVEEDTVRQIIRALVERHHDELDALRALIRDRDEKITTLQQMLERAHTTENA